MDGFLTPSQVCAWARIELRELLEALALGGIPAASFGGRRRMRASAVRAYFQVYGDPPPPIPGADKPISQLAIDACRSAHVVYRCYGRGDELLYVGVTGNAHQRLQAHADKFWWPDVARIEIKGFDTRADAEDHERKAIWFERPAHNRRGQAREFEGCAVVVLPDNWPREGGAA